MPAVRTETIRLDTADGPMACYEAVPESPRAGVVVIQEAFGVNDYIERVARDLAGAGYHAVAPHLFHRTGPAVVVGYDDLARAVELIGTLTDEGILADVDAALERLRSVGLDDRRIGIVGFCMGGRVTFLAAARRAIGAGVGFYGGGIVRARTPRLAALIDEAASLRTPWLGLFGDADPSIPVDDVERLREALRAAPVETGIVRYPGAGHGFHCDARDSFEPEVAADAWRRTLAWLERHLGA